MGGEYSPIVRLAGQLLRLKYQGTRAVAEQHARRAVIPVEDSRKGFRPDDQRALVASTSQQAIGYLQRIDEARANRLQVKSRAVRNAKPGLHRHSSRRKRLVWCRSRKNDEINGACFAV